MSSLGAQPALAGCVVARQLLGPGAAVLSERRRCAQRHVMLIQLLARFIANGSGGREGAACGCPVQPQPARELSEELPQEPGDQ
jgi:hypothetical protein